MMTDSFTFTQAVLDTLKAHIAVLDQAGNIIAVNEAWRRFGRENGLKLLDFTGFVAVIRSIRHFWFTIVKLPSEVDYG